MSFRKNRRPPDAAIYFDEGTSQTSAELDRQQRHLGPLATLALRARGGSLALMFSYHSPSSVSRIITANAHISLVGHLLNEEDIKTVKNACALTSEQAYSLSHLGVGQFMVKLGSSQTFPFLIQVDPIRHIRLSQDEIDKNNAVLLARLPKIEPEKDFEVFEVEVTPSKQKEEKLLEIAILEDIHRRMFVGTTERFKDFSINGKRFPRKACRSELTQLEKDGFCESDSFRLSPKGAPTLFHLLTDLGYQKIGFPEDRIIPRPGTGMRHRFRQKFCVKEVFKNQSIRAVVEAEKNGKHADVGVEHNGISVAIEMALSTERTEPKQAKADLEAGWDKVIVVFNDRETCERAVPEFEKELGATAGNSVTLVEFWHLVQFPIEVVYNHPNLLFITKTKPR